MLELVGFRDTSIHIFKLPTLRIKRTSHEKLHMIAQRMFFPRFLLILQYFSSDDLFVFTSTVHL